MANGYYTHTTYPAPNSQGASASMRAELAAIMAGFDLLPDPLGFGLKGFSDGTFQNATIQGGTLDGVVIGGTDPAAAEFESLIVDTTSTLTGAVTFGAGGTLNGTITGGTLGALAGLAITGGSLDNTPIGDTLRSTIKANRGIFGLTLVDDGASPLQVDSKALITGAGAGLYVNDQLGNQNSNIYFMAAGVTDWALRADYAGGHFRLNRYTAGTFTDVPLSVDYATGLTTLTLLEVQGATLLDAGGTLNGTFTAGATGKLNGFAISGGSLDNTPIGATTANTIKGTTLTLNSAASNLKGVGTPSATTDGANKSYVDTVAALNGRVLIGSVACTGTTVPTFVNLPSGYAAFELELDGLLPIVTDVMFMQFSANNGSSWLSSAQYTASLVTNSSSQPANNAPITTPQVNAVGLIISGSMTATNGTPVWQACSGRIRLNAMNQDGVGTMAGAVWQISYADAAGAVVQTSGAGRRVALGEGNKNGVRLVVGGLGFAKGLVRLYGIL